jgi:hypothetical protein
LELNTKPESWVLDFLTIWLVFLFLIFGSFEYSCKSTIDSQWYAAPTLFVNFQVQLSLRQSDLEKPFLSYHDIKVCSVVMVTVVSIEDFGLVVKLADNIRGLLNFWTFSC